MWKYWFIVFLSYLPSLSSCKLFLLCFCPITPNSLCTAPLQVLKSFRNLKTQPFFSVLQFSTLSNHLKSYFPHQERHHQMVRLFASALYHFEDIRLLVFTLSIYSLQTCSRLQDMCVVFAGPFPTGFSDGDVKQLFSFCGAVRKVKMLNTVVRVCIAFIVSPIRYETRAAKFFTVAWMLKCLISQVHAEIEFELLEGAMLAVKTLNGLNVLGQSIKVALFLFLFFPFASVIYSLCAAVRPTFMQIISNYLLFSRYRGRCVSQC